MLQVLLSMTRLAFPSLRWMLCGSTRRSSTASPRLLQSVLQVLLHCDQRADAVAEHSGSFPLDFDLVQPFSRVSTIW